jgi:hypothetical protein
MLQCSMGEIIGISRSLASAFCCGATYWKTEPKNLIFNVTDTMQTI